MIDRIIRSFDCISKQSKTKGHYNDVIMTTMASQITSLTIVYWSVYSDADQRKHQSSAPLAFVRGIHRGPVNSPHKGPVTRKMFPYDDVIMNRQVIIDKNFGDNHFILPLRSLGLYQVLCIFIFHGRCLDFSYLAQGISQKGEKCMQHFMNRH